jgi:protein ImuB
VPQDRPFALVERGPHGIGISAINRQAWMKGVRVGQALTDARAILPELMTRPGEVARDVFVLERLALWLGRYGPSRNIEGDDGLWVDITGVAHLFGGEEGLARVCVEKLGAAGFMARLGIGDTRSGAYALARYGCRRGKAVAIAPRGDMGTALRELPVEALQLKGDLVVLLGRLGLKRIGELYGLPRAALERRFRDGAATGRGGRRRGVSSSWRGRQEGWAEALVMRLDQALGVLSEPAKSLCEPPLFRAQRSYAEPLISHDGIVAALNSLAEDLCDHLAVRSMGTRRVEFQVYRSDGEVMRLNIRASRPVARAGHLVDLFTPRLERVDAGLGIDALVLEAFDCAVLAAEQANIAERNAAGCNGGFSGGFDALVDRLANRLGTDAVYYLKPVDRHVPELAQARVPALGEPSGENGSTGRTTVPRPLFLLDPPERIEVLADVPDGPPARFKWRRITRRVVRAEGPERIAPEWWRQLFVEGDPRGREAQEGIVVGHPRWRTRDYYRIEDAHGAQYWVYRAGLYGAYDAYADSDGELLTGEPTAAREMPVWFLQGIF